MAHTTYILVILLWSSLIEAKQFNTEALLPRPKTGYSNSSEKNTRYLEINGAPRKVHLKLFTSDLDRAMQFVNENVNRMQRLETNLGWSDIMVDSGTPSEGQVLVSYPENKAMQKGKEAVVASKATIHLMHKFCRGHHLSKMECAKYMSTIKLTDSSFKGFCPDLGLSCSKREVHSKYRSIDGSCNHAFDRSKGQSFTSYKRLLFPDYLDGVQEPRRSVHKRHGLPSAREISSNLIKHENDFDDFRTMMVPQWAQFVAHDLTHTVSSRMLHSGKNIKCCTTTGRKLSPRYMHPFCAPIEIERNDKFYSQHGLRCMSYVRSVPAMRPSCALGPLEQLNQATHFLDGSMIYGSENEKANQLRLFKNGLLKTSPDHRRTFLPIDDDAESIFGHYLSGDVRVNSIPTLTAMHTIWLREHNRIAAELRNMNPNWNDEILYQEAKRIVIAELQHITYNEWLPTVLGESYILKLKFPMDAIRYLDMIEDPSVSNSFATAAMRFGKSLIANELGLYTEGRKLNSTIRYKDYFNNGVIVETPEYLDAILRGLATEASQRMDLNFGTDITSQLYSAGKYGYDVISLDIQRGRDHGLPGYTAYRSLCGLPEVKTFNDFSPYISKDIIDILSKIYRDPHDVDLLIGGLAENPDADSLLGPTFSCIVADQFLRTKYGDRYFYQHNQQPKPFTEKQLAEIQRITLARVLCDNGDNMKTMQPNVFKKIASSNSLVSCQSETIQHLNLYHWMES